MYFGSGSDKAAFPEEALAGPGVYLTATPIPEKLNGHWGIKQIRKNCYL